MKIPRSTDNYDVYLVGRYFTDLVFTRLPEMPRLGHEVYAREFHMLPGGAATPAIALTRLGLSVAWPCFFGSDAFSRPILSLVIAEKVEASFFHDLDKPALHISVAFSFADERAFLSYADPLPNPPHEDLIRRARPEWLYLANLHMGEKLRRLAGAARDAGARIYMDCQAQPGRPSENELTEALGLVDVFSPNLEEACLLSGEQDTEKALLHLSDLTETVIIKTGADGCVCRNNNTTYQASGVPASVVDTTGAGDNFNCGFLFGQINGFSLADSLRIANICGGLSVEGYGGVSTSPTREKVLALL